MLNNSYGGPGKSLSALDAIQQLNAAGILFVVAAGNDTSDNFLYEDFPANYDVPNVLAVAATDSFDSLSSFSNFSSRLVSLGAPGSSILSTIARPNAGAAYGYAFVGGTSMASPHVAGSAALVCSALPDCANNSAVNSGISVKNLRGVLAYTGDRLTPSLDFKTTTNRRLNVANAVQSALENDTTAPAQVGNLRVTSAVGGGRNITLAWTATGDDGNNGTAADYDFFYVHPTTGVKSLLPTNLAPAPSGTQQSVVVTAPYRNFSSTILMRTYDNAGNSSDTTVGVTNPGQLPQQPLHGFRSLPVPDSSHHGVSLVNGDDQYTTISCPSRSPFFARTHFSRFRPTAHLFRMPPHRATAIPAVLCALHAQMIRVCG